MLTESQRQAVVQLQDYLTRIAHNLHHIHWPQVAPEDILQEMNLHIAERAETEPRFLDQTPGYITKAAAWHARHWCRDTFTRYRNGERVSAGLPLETDDEDERPADEVYAASEPDRDLVLDIREALAGLDEVAYQVAQMKMAGWKRKDIAAELRTSSQNLCQHYRHIEAALKPVWDAMTGTQGEPARQLSLVV